MTAWWLIAFVSHHQCTGDNCAEASEWYGCCIVEAVDSDAAVARVELLGLHPKVDCMTVVRRCDGYEGSPPEHARNRLIESQIEAVEIANEWSLTRAGELT